MEHACNTTATSSAPCSVDSLMTKLSIYARGTDSLYAYASVSAGWDSLRAAKYSCTPPSTSESYQRAGP